MQGHILCTRLWRFDPEGDEFRELFPRWIAGFQRQPPCGQTISLPGTDASEIAGALKHGVFAVLPAVIQVRAQAQPGITQRVINGHIGELIGAVKHIQIKGKGTRGSTLNGVNLHRTWEVQTGWEHIHALRAVGAFPQCIAAVEPDFAILIIGQLSPIFGDHLSWFVRFCGKRACAFNDLISGEWGRFPKLQTWFGRLRQRRRCGQGCKGRQEFASQHHRFARHG